MNRQLEIAKRFEESYVPDPALVNRQLKLLNQLERLNVKPEMKKILAGDILKQNKENLLEDSDFNQ